MCRVDQAVQCQRAFAVWRAVLVVALVDRRLRRALRWLLLHRCDRAAVCQLRADLVDQRVKLVVSQGLCALRCLLRRLGHAGAVGDRQQHANNSFNRAGRWCATLRWECSVAAGWLLPVHGQKRDGSFVLRDEECTRHLSRCSVKREHGTTLPQLGHSVRTKLLVAAAPRLPSPFCFCPLLPLSLPVVVVDFAAAAASAACAASGPSPSFLSPLWTTQTAVKQSSRKWWQVLAVCVRCMGLGTHTPSAVAKLRCTSNATSVTISLTSTSQTITICKRLKSATSFCSCFFWRVCVVLACRAP